MKQMLYLGSSCEAEPYIKMDETLVMTQSVSRQMYNLELVGAGNDVWFGFFEGYEFETTRSMRGIGRLIRRGRRGIVAPHQNEPYAEVTQLALNEHGDVDTRVYRIAAPFRELPPEEGRVALIGATARALFDFAMRNPVPDVRALYERQIETMEQAAVLLDQAAGLSGQS